MGISHYLSQQLVLFLNASTRDLALDELISHLEKTGKLQNAKAFREAINEREKVASTGIGLGVAVPHAKLHGYDDFFIVIGIQNKKGIEWNALDKAPVNLIFLIGGPENRQTEYLKILSHVTMAVKNEERRKKMLRAQDAKEVIALFEGC